MSDSAYGQHNAFFRAREIEARGWGIRRIVGACRMASGPTPAVHFEANGLWVEFPFSPDYLALIRGARVEAPIETPVEALMRTPSRILAVLHRQPAATLHEVAAALGLSTSAVERAARRLQEEGRLRRVGPKKGGRWEVLR
jgi:ATP-dependent DNA helicase RecG